MFELKECKERAYRRFHERFSESLLKLGFQREETGYYIADMENGYIVNVNMRPSCTGDICDIDIGLRTISDNHLFLYERMFGKDDPEALWNVGDYSLLHTFYGSGKAYDDRGKMESMVDVMHTGFIEKVYPILLSIHDEKTCYNAMVLMDRIFPTKLARDFVYTAIAYGYIKRAVQRIRAIRRRKDDMLWTYQNEYLELLELLETENTNEVSALIERNRADSRGRFYAYKSKWGY